jgi:hypothetical protein
MTLQAIFSKLSKKRRYQLYALKEFLRAQPRPILVYQMAKVGSTSVYRSLRAAGLYPLHVHSVTEESCRDGFKFYSRHGATPPIHLYVSLLLRPYLRCTSHRLKVISLVRDPVARYVSKQYQTAEYLSNPDMDNLGAVAGDVERTKQNIREQLAEPGVMDYTFGWFDRQIKAMLDLDVLAEPFDKERGFGLHEGPRVDVLVLKLERLSDLIPTVVSDFVGRELQVTRANDRRQTERGDEYARVKSELLLPAATIERIYGHEWVRHFYTQDEIESFRARWGDEQALPQ